MRRRLQPMPILFAFAVLAPAVAAEELEFSLGGTTAWETDIGQGRGGDDLVWELRPRARLEGERRRFRYELDYTMRAEFYRRLTELNDQGHILRAFGELQVSPTSTWTAENTFSVVPSIRRLSEVEVDATGEVLFDETGEQIVDVEFEQEDILTNRFSTTYTMRPWRRIEGVVTLEHFLRDLDGTGAGSTLVSRDIDALTLTSTASYLFDETKRAGMGFRYRRRESSRAGTAGLGDELDVVSTFYDLFLTWRQDLDPRTFLSVRVGPSLSSDEVDDPSGSFEVNSFPLAPGDPRRLVLPSASCGTVNTAAGPVRVLTSDCEAILFSAVLNPFPPPAIRREPVPELDDDQLETLADLTREVSFLPGEDEEDLGGSNVNIFAAVTLERSWDHWQWSLRYNRSDSQTLSAGSKTVLDSVSTSLRWTPSPRWRGLFTFRFSRRTTDLESGSPVPVLGGVTAVPELGTFPVGGLLFPFFGTPVVGFANLESERSFFIDFFGAQVRFQRDLSPRALVFAEVEWRRQDGGGDLAFAGADDRYQFRVGFRYRFQPIRL